MSTTQPIRPIPGLPGWRFVNPDEVAQGLVVTRFFPSTRGPAAGSRAEVLEVKNGVLWKFIDNEHHEKPVRSLMKMFTGPAAIIFALPVSDATPE